MNKKASVFAKMLMPYLQASVATPIRKVVTIGVIVGLIYGIKQSRKKEEA